MTKAAGFFSSPSSFEVYRQLANNWCCLHHSTSTYSALFIAATHNVIYTTNFWWKYTLHSLDYSPKPGDGNTLKSHFPCQKSTCLMETHGITWGKFCHLLMCIRDPKCMTVTNACADTMPVCVHASVSACSECSHSKIRWKAPSQPPPASLVPLQQLHMSFVCFCSLNKINHTNGDNGVQFQAVSPQRLKGLNKRNYNKSTCPRLWNGNSSLLQLRENKEQRV